MVTVCDLLRRESEIIKEKDKLRVKVSEEKRLRELDESTIWLTTDFKGLGYTNDKMRGAFVDKKMNEFPNKYLDNKNKLIALEEELTFVRDCIKTMREFGIEEFDDKDKDKDKGSSS